MNPSTLEILVIIAVGLMAAILFFLFIKGM